MLRRKNPRDRQPLVAEGLESRIFLSAVLVKDINTSKINADITPGYLTAAGSVAYFTDSDGVTGDEVWKTDGTAAGTSLVDDIIPGVGSSYPGYYATIGSITYFNATDSTDGSELWRTDGTAAGTYLVKDINPGSASSNPNNLTAYNGALYFFADDGVHGSELWKSDGTTAGTVLVDDTDVGASGQSSQTYFFHRIAVTGNNTMFFLGFDGTNNNLYTTTGAVGNETLVKTLQYAPTIPGLLANNASLVFYTDILGYVYQSNGTTSGTVTDDPTNSTDSNLTIAGNYLYYVRGSVIKCVGGGVTQTVPGTFSSETILGALGTSIMLSSTNTSTGHTQLWVIYAGGASDSLVMDNISPVVGTAVNGVFDFAAGTSAAGYGLYKTTSQGLSPTLITSISAGGTLPAPSSFVALGSKLLFVNSDLVNGTQPWVSDGTAAGTGLLKAVYPGTAGSSPYVWNLTANGRLFFTANDGVTGIELYSTDGTSANTVELKDINPGYNSSSPTNLLAVGSKVYFAAYDPVDGNALWVTDGTPAGTSMIIATDPGVTTANPIPMAWVNGYLLFSATDSTHGTELWRTDGTTANTQLLEDIYTGASSSSPSRAMVMNGVAYFTATDSTHGTELWRSDGTAAGTYLVDDIYPGSSSSGVSSLFVYGNTLLFSAESNTTIGYELWKSDGTAAGTVLVKDIRSGGSSSPSGFALYNGLVYFAATDATGTSGLWVTDGTAAGTQLIGEDSPTQLTALNGKLYFIGSDSLHSSQLFVSQGTPSTTAPVNDVNPPTIMAPLAAIGGRLFFVAADTSGASYELWTSDGTSAGTSMVQDLFPGFGQGVGGNLLGLNGAVFARGDNSVSGAELYEFPDIYPPTVYAEFATVTGATLARSINFSFTENVSANLSASSLQLQNLTTGLAVSTASTGYSYNTSTNTATFTLPAAALSDGRYRATIAASLLVDPQGNIATSAATLEFVSVAVATGTNTISLVPSSDGSSLLVYKNGAQTFTTPWASLGSVVVTGGAGNDSLFITLGATIPSGGYSFDGGGGSNTMTVAGTTGSHTVTSSAVGLMYDNVSMGAINIAPILFNPAGGIDGFNIYAPMALAPSGTTTLTISALNDQSTLDLTNNAVDFTGSTMSAIQALVQSGFNAGTWTGAGIDSSVAGSDSSHLTALGVIQNNQGGTALFSASHLFDGVSPGATDVLVKYTYYGDINFDGKVDGSDYSRIDSAFLNHTLTGWYNGDFNYDGAVNGSDYTLIDNTFNRQGASLAAIVADAIEQPHPTTAVSPPIDQNCERADMRSSRKKDISQETLLLMGL